MNADARRPTGEVRYRRDEGGNLYLQQRWEHIHYELITDSRSGRVGYEPVLLNIEWEDVPVVEGANA